MKAIKTTLLATTVLASSVAMANTTTHTAGTMVDGTRTIFSTLTNPAAVSVEAGSLGYGANIGWAINETAELQAGWAGGNVTDLLKGNFKVDGATYDIKTDLNNPYLGVQVRPAGNWFTVGVGTLVPKNKIKATLRSNESATIKIDDVVYDATNAKVEAQLKHKNKMAPYLTVGFRPNLNNNWGVFGEIGGAYMGNVDAKVKVVDGTVTQRVATPTPGTAVPAATGVVVASNEFEQRAKQSIENKQYATWYPIAKLGVTYRF